jgi:type IV secretory pathway TraG/TraD family ATPase VirD4
MSARDFTARSHGLWAWRVAQWMKRWRYFASVVAGCAGVGIVLAMQYRVPPGATGAALQYLFANLLAWIGDGTGHAIQMNVSIGGETRKVSVFWVAQDAWFESAWGFVFSALMRGGLGGSGLGMLVVWLLSRNMRDQGREGLGDRVIGGTRIVPQSELARRVGNVAPSALRIGPVPLPHNFETRHFALIGTTGSGKTTALRQLLDGIEARGEAAIVYDTSGEFVAHYYRPERGDVILNPFDERCVTWSPFDEIQHPADADRIAHQLVSETGSKDDDVWLETSRILVANILRALWVEGNGTLEALLDALQMRTKEQLKAWLGNSSSARTFADDADRATGSVLFMLAKASNLIQFLRAEDATTRRFAFRRHIASIDDKAAARPWIFVPRKEDYFEAAKPLLACWLECAASAVLGLPPDAKRRVWFLLDELADLPRVDNLARLLPEGRKFGAAVVLTFQALGQMRHRYGVPIAEAMLACCNTKLFLQTVDRETRAWASDTIGDCEIEMRTAADMLAPGAATQQTTLATHRVIRAAVLESELRLPPRQGFLLLPDGHPVARITLSNAHVVARGSPHHPAFIAAAHSQTLWSRMAARPGEPPSAPGLV